MGAQSGSKRLPSCGETKELEAQLGPFQRRLEVQKMLEDSNHGDKARADGQVRIQLEVRGADKRGVPWPPADRRGVQANKAADNLHGMWVLGD